MYNLTWIRLTQQPSHRHSRPYLIHDLNLWVRVSNACVTYGPLHWCAHSAGNLGPDGQLEKLGLQIQMQRQSAPTTEASKTFGDGTSPNM